MQQQLRTISYYTGGWEGSCTPPPSSSSSTNAKEKKQKKNGYFISFLLSVCRLCFSFVLNQPDYFISVCFCSLSFLATGFNRICRRWRVKWRRRNRKEVSAGTWRPPLHRRWPPDSAKVQFIIQPFNFYIWNKEKGEGMYETSNDSHAIEIASDRRRQCSHLPKAHNDRISKSLMNRENSVDWKFCR